MGLEPQSAQCDTEMSPITTSITLLITFNEDGLKRNIFTTGTAQAVEERNVRTSGTSSAPEIGCRK